MDRGAWQANIVHGVAKSRTRLSDFTLLSRFTYDVVLVYGTQHSDPGIRMNMCSFHTLPHCVYHRC